MSMKMSFRWYGEDDPVTLTNIGQIPEYAFYCNCSV